MKASRLRLNSKRPSPSHLGKHKLGKTTPLSPPLLHAHPTRGERLGQNLTLIALLLTVLFSCFSWLEARATRADQRAFFLAEKAPRLELLKMRGTNHIVYITVRNSGESVARQVRFRIEHEPPFESHADSMRESLARTVSLSKGESVELPVDLVRFSPSTTVINPITGATTNPSLYPLEYREKVPGGVLDLAFTRGTLVHIEYEDFGGNKYGLRKVFEVTATRQ
jgi:hypothetical protein